MSEFNSGDFVRIKSGPFASFTSRVESVDEEKGILIARLEIFGRSTPLEVTFSEAEKVLSDRPPHPPWNSLN